MLFLKRCKPFSQKFERLKKDTIRNRHTLLANTLFPKLCRFHCTYHAEHSFRITFDAHGFGGACGYRRSGLRPGSWQPVLIFRRVVPLIIVPFIIVLAVTLDDRGKVIIS